MNINVGRQVDVCEGEGVITMVSLEQCDVGNECAEG